MKDLVHVEEQISRLCGLPDFGYGRDNYIFNYRGPTQSHWESMTQLIHDHSRFDWLMNFIKLGDLAQKIKQEREKEVELRE
jgi:hypothetical protein